MIKGNFNLWSNVEMAYSRNVPCFTSPLPPPPSLFFLPPSTLHFLDMLIEVLFAKINHDSFLFVVFLLKWFSASAQMRTNITIEMWQNNITFISVSFLCAKETWAKNIESMEAYHSSETRRTHISYRREDVDWRSTSQERPWCNQNEGTFSSALPINSIKCNPS